MACRLRAESGDAQAQCDMGIAYAYGHGVAQDYAMSAAWYSRAADQGLARAQHNLAGLYLNGQGVTKDRAEALKWLGLEEAGAVGDEKAALGAVMKNLATTMTTAEVADAQRRASNWLRGFARKMDLSTLSAMTFYASASVVAPNAVGVVPPRLLKEAKPEYSSAAKERKIEGIVVLECIVLVDGKVGECQVAQSLDKESGLDDRAIKAVRKWRFEPGTRDGLPVPVLVTIELTFRLR